MGTNYYLHQNVCSQCGRSDKQLHIGKSSGGWTFSFRGYRSIYNHPHIRSYKEWLHFLNAEIANGSVIKDEYGDIVTISDFKNLVEAKRNEKYNHTIYCRDSHPEHAERDCWLDDEGHSFSDHEFS